ncbi:MAG: hypothetical protein JO293_07445 [Candidatus Eremiobacteraeota bacterium]|nr:hypothetical protein [Candidatus Eremiobacteraeota bacterium]MBV8223182.1 hypothetical protein [Candidatus Eremiobacteraeota bacterium]
MKRFNHLAIAVAALAAPLLIVLSAKADLAQLNDGAPVVRIQSNGGRILVHPGEPDGVVRIPGNAPGVQMNRFDVPAQASVCVPRPQALMPRRGGRPGLAPPPPQPACVPHNFNLRPGPHGVAINNPGSDIEVGVPNRTELMYIQGGTSPVTMERTRGPFFITGQNDVILHGVAGAGTVLTLGNIDARNPQGNLTAGTLNGHITLVSNAALDKATLVDRDTGDIDWTIEGVGGGPYRVQSGSGTARLYVRPGVGANITATSLGGTVNNLLDPSIAEVGVSRPHAVSMTVNGGGAQITVNSESGNIVIAPAP